MSHTHTFRGRETTAQALGTTWTFSRWELDKLDEWVDWARTKLPDPLAAATAQIERMMEEEDQRTQAAKTDLEKTKLQAWLARRAKIKDELVETAMQKATSHLDFGSAEIQSLLRSLRGLAQLAFLLLREHHPAITTEQAFGVVAELGQEEIQRILDTTMGMAPPAAKNGLAPAEPNSSRGDLAGGLSKNRCAKSRKGR